MGDNSQKDAIAFLSTPGSYGVAGIAIERCETHGAIVFLAGDFAYKLKRAMRYPYMDYSTAALRRRMCQRELAVNRLTAPDFYLEVRAIVRDRDGSLRWGSAREEQGVIDWVVVMRRFAQEALLEQIRVRGGLTPPLLRALAETIARFHGQAEMRRDFGGGAITAIVDENISILRSMTGAPFARDEVDRLEELSRAALKRTHALLEARRENGFVRRCHGDLHLNNICLIDGKPVLFDAIEFNDEFACIDVFYDLAFLLMDLDRHGLRAEANLVLNRYLERTQDYGGLGALPLFLSCRAAIRAHVAVSRARAASASAAPTEEPTTLLARAISYLALAPPRLIAIGGVSGTGKSTLAYALAPALGASPGAAVIRSDIVRKRIMGVDENTRLPQAGYAPEISARVFARLAELAKQILSAGYAVIVDAVYGDAGQRAEIEGAARAASVAFDGLWLRAPTALLEQRVGARSGDASDATLAVLKEQLARIQEPAEWRKIEAGGAPGEVLAEARKVLFSREEET